MEVKHCNTYSGLFSRRRTAKMSKFQYFQSSRSCRVLRSASSSDTVSRLLTYECPSSQSSAAPKLMTLASMKVLSLLTIRDLRPAFSLSRTCTISTQRLCDSRIRTTKRSSSAVCMALGGLGDSVCSKPWIMSVVYAPILYPIFTSSAHVVFRKEITYRVRRNIGYCLLSKAIRKCPKQLAVHVRARRVI